MTLDHGTWQRYARRSTKCRCVDCREAWRAYRSRQNRDIAYGRVTVDSFVDAGPARAHVNALRAQGCGQKSIARITGVAPVTIYRICNGTATRVRTSTSVRLLAATIEPDRMLERAKVDGTGTRRRIRALVAMGWSNGRLGARLGCTKENVRQIVNGPDGGLVTVGLSRRVAALYDELWDRQPVCTSKPQRNAVDAARRTAARHGWHGPLAWDDDTIDDPDAEPYTDARPSSSQRPADDVAAEVDDLLDLDPHATANDIAARLGYADRSGVQNALDRAGRRDLLDVLARNATLADYRSA